MIISGKELSAKMKAAMAEEVKTFPEKAPAQKQAIITNHAKI